RAVIRAPLYGDVWLVRVEKLSDIYFLAGMQPQLIRPAWTFCRAACPRRPGDRITVPLLRRISPLLAREGPNSNFEPLCQLAPVVNGWGFFRRSSRYRGRTGRQWPSRPVGRGILGSI